MTTLINKQLDGQKNGLYDYTNMMLSYNSSKLDGSSLSFSDIETLYSQDYVITGGHSMDDLMVARNQFKMFEFMLKTIDEPLTVKMIKKYDQILKKGTMYQHFHDENAQLNKFPGIMDELLDKYNSLNKVELIDILSFYHGFVHIHPLQNRNGIVGRILMFRQCIINNFTPFILSFIRRNEYIDALKSFEKDPNVFLNEAVLQQKEYEKVASSFIESHTDKIKLELKP
ncbi:Fic family protein [Oceanobacillus jeddahense]|nr:Fic family protein [Oceanobacillus jeddahense]